MRIAISALHFTPGNPSSPERFLTGLINTLARVDPDNEYLVFTRPDNRHYFRLQKGKLRDILFPSLLRYRWARILCEQTVLPVVLAIEKVDLYHFPATVGPVVLPCKSVGTVHSVIDPMLGKTLPWYRRLYFAVLYRLSTARADRLIAVSAHCQSEMAKWLHISPEKIEVVHHGVESHFRPDGAEDELRATLAKFGITKPYIFCPAAPEPHKNLARLVEAYCGVRGAGLDYQLVIIGGPRERYLSFIKEGTGRAGCSFARDIMICGYVTHFELLRLYRGAALLANVSYNETFGFPALEAMASGTPVVVSNITALPETVGDAGLLVNPFDVNDITQQLVRVLSDAELRSELRAKGLERAKSFTWEAAARKTLGVYKKVLRSELADDDTGQARAAAAETGQLPR